MVKVEFLVIDSDGYIGTAQAYPSEAVGEDTLIGDGAYVIRTRPKSGTIGSRNFLASLISGKEAFGVAYIFAVDYDGELTRDIGRWRG